MSKLLPKISWRNRSLLLRFLLSYLLILIIPFATVFFTFQTAIGYVRRDIHLYQKSQMQQITASLDTRISQANQMFVQISSEFQVRAASGEDWLHQEISPYTSYKLKNYLSNIFLEGAQDILIYFPGSDRVCSRQYYSISDFFYQSRYGGRISKERWDGWINQTTRPMLISFPDESGRDTLMLQQYMDFNQNGRNAVLALVLESNWIYSLFQSSVGNGIFFIYSSTNNQLLLSSEPEPWPIELSGQEWEEGSFVRYEHNGERYMIQKSVSNYGYYYYYALPAGEYWESLNAFRNIGLCGIILCCLISLLLMVVLANRNYNPVTLLVQTINSKIPLQEESSENKNEFELIDHAIQQLLANQEDLASTLKNHQQKLQKDCLLQLLQGQLPEPGGKELLEHSGIVLPHPGVCVMLIQLDRCEEDIIGGSNGQDIIELAGFLIQNVLEDLFSAASQFYFVDVKPRLYGGILNFPQDAETTGSLVTLCREAQEFLAKRLHIYCSVNLGNVASLEAQDVLAVYQSYQAALQAQNYRYLLGTGRVLAYEQLTFQGAHYRSIQTPKVRQMLLNFLKFSGEAGREISPERLFTQIQYEAFGENEPTLETVRSLQRDLLSLLRQMLSANLLDFGAQEPPSGDDIARFLNSAEDYEQYCARLFRLLERLRDSQTHTEKYQDLCNQINLILQQDYGNPEININYLGSKVGLSPSYLSKIYRQQYGTSPLTYLNTLRLEKAKELLRQDTLTIEEIAARVGFLSSSSFIRAFKKQEGVTPGSFKKL